MRYTIPLAVACSGLAIAASITPTQTLAAEQIKTNNRIAAALNAQPTSVAESSVRKVICSRNYTLQANPEGTKVAALPEGLTWASNIVQLFCRDVRINMIVVKDYCAVVRK
jgi:hypothetical protein